MCHSDLHVMKAEIPFATPCVVGHEITGEVIEHGQNTDSKTIERLTYFPRTFVYDNAMMCLLFDENRIVIDDK